jgi:hypothetical protein
MAEKDWVAARVTMRGIHLGEFHGLAPIGKRVEDKAIDMFHVSGGKIVEHCRHGDDPTDFPHPPGVPDRPRTPIVGNSRSCIEIGFLSTFDASYDPSKGARPSTRAANEPY